MKKYSLIVAFLSFVALFEGLILFYDAFFSSSKAYPLDSYEYINKSYSAEKLPAPEPAEIKTTAKTADDNFAFAFDSMSAVHQDLDNLHENLSQSALHYIADIFENDENAEEAKIEEPTPIAADDNIKSNQLPQIAIVIDDVGLSTEYVKKIADLHKPLTASMLTYGAANKQKAEILQNAGVEIMVHVPMMPHIPANLAPITLSPEMSEAEVKADLNAMLDRYEGVAIAGINNHMGSLFTERTKGMSYVMQVLHERGLFFLDSKTTAKSVGKEVAAEFDVKYIARDVFLDNENKYDYIMGQLEQTEKVAKRQGHAVAIGHPHSETIKALHDWLQNVEAKGFKVVRISELFNKNSEK